MFAVALLLESLFQVRTSAITFQSLVFISSFLMFLEVQDYILFSVPRVSDNVFKYSSSHKWGTRQE
jgi:hypothetical protein